MKPVDNAPVTPEDIDWDKAEENDCPGCPCFNCEDDALIPYACRQDYCEYGGEMCSNCPVRILL